MKKTWLVNARTCTALAICFVGLSYWLFWHSGFTRQKLISEWLFRRNNSSNSCLAELMATFGIAAAGLNVSETTYIRLAKPATIGPACRSVLQHNMTTVNFTEPKILDSDQQVQIHTIVYQLLQNFTQRKLEMFICGGSLLGSVRHFGLFPWDADVDLMILSGQKAQARQLLIDVSAADEFRFVDTERANGHWQLGIFCQPQRDKPPTRMYGTKRFYPEKFCKTIVDFFFGQVNRQYYTRLEYPARFPVSDVYPLRLRPYGPYLVPAPKEAGKFLLAVYGSDYELKCKFKYYVHRVFRCAELHFKYPFVTHLQFAYSGSQQLHMDVLVNQSNLLALFIPPQEGPRAKHSFSKS